MEKEPEGATSADPAPQFLLSQKALQKALDERYGASLDCDNPDSKSMGIGGMETPLNLPEVNEETLFQGASPQQRQHDKAIADKTNSFARLSRHLESTLEERLSFPS